MNRLGRLIGIVLAGVLLFGVVGCGNGNSTDNTSGQTSQGTTVSDSSNISDESSKEESKMDNSNSGGSSKNPTKSQAGVSSGKNTTSSKSVSSGGSKDYGDVKAVPYNPSVSPQMTGVLNLNPNKVINNNLIGGGVNFDYSSYLFIDLESGAEWTGLRSQHIPYYYGIESVEDQLWDEYFKLIDFSGMKYVRLGVSLTMWEPINDNADPFKTDFEKGFIFSPKFKTRSEAAKVPKNTYLYIEKFYKLLDYFEKKGLYVILANWDIGTGQYCPDGINWLAKKKPDGSYYSGADRTVIGVNSMDEYAETFAAIMYHLKVEKKYNCVKGFSFWNEPELLSNYEETLVNVYNKLGEHLNRLKIRDKVLIQAYDGAMFYNTTTGSIQDQVARMLPKCGKNMDILSFHDYQSSIEADIGLPGTQGTILKHLIGRFATPAVEQGQGRIVVAGEFGSKGYGGETEQSPKNFMSKIHAAESVIQMFNAGVKGYGFWIYNCHYHNYWTMLDYDPDFPQRMIPDSTNYYPNSLMMKYIPSGANIVSSTITGCTDSKAQRVFATTAVKGKDVTVLLVNDSNQPAKVTVKGLDTTKTYRQHFVADGLHDRIYPGMNFEPGKNNILAIRPKSIVVLTTYTYGAQTVR